MSLSTLAGLTTGDRGTARRYHDARTAVAAACCAAICRNPLSRDGAGVAAAVDTAFPELFRWLGERGVEPAGPPFIRLLEVDVDGEPLELEVGRPLRMLYRSTSASRPTLFPPVAT